MTATEPEVVISGAPGVAPPCRFRVATERTTLVMPKTGVGLVPTKARIKDAESAPGWRGWMISSKGRWR
jgi:enoyl-CoA hydratase